MKKVWLLLFLICLVLIFFPRDYKKEVIYKDYIQVINEYPHKTDSFTEGLFFNDGKLFESTGLYGKSKMYKDINLKSGEADDFYSFSDDIFAEGSVIFKNKLYVLTYKENKAFVFNKDTLEMEREYEYFKEGWGLTTDGRYLIASDGSSNIYFMDGNFNDKFKITVKLNGEEIDNINELEYINGYIWANVWKSDDVVIVNPQSGNVVKKINFRGILSDDLKNENTDVLNGIAYNEGKLYITGKNYPLIFECKIKEKLYKEIK